MTLIPIAKVGSTSVDAEKVQIMDGSGNQITSFGGGTQYTSGGATPANPVGNALIFDNAGTLTAVSSTNPLPVSATISGSGLATAAKQDSQTALLTTIDTDTGDIVTSVQLIDDTVATLGTTTYTEATTKGLTIGVVRRDADTTLVNTTNEIGPLQMDANGRLKVEAFSGETLPVSMTSTTITGTVAATQSGTWILGANSGVDIGDVTINNASGASAVNVQDGGNSITVDQATGTNLHTVVDSGTITTVSTVTNLSQLGGTAISMNTGVRDAGTQRVTIATNDVVPITDNSGSLTVDQPTGSNLHTVVDSGTVTTVSTVTSVTQNADVRQATAANLNAQVVGTIAHDSADSGNPVKVGMKALAHGTNPTGVTANDRTDWYANRAGIPFMIGGHPNIISIEAAYTGAQTDTAIVSVGSGVKIVVTKCSVMCDNANTVDVGVRVGFGATNTPTTTGVILTHPGIAPGSGVIEGGASGMIGVGADAEDLRITCEVPTGGSVRVLATYFTIES